MFEKFSISDIDSAGRGGEYTVQAGFGWTNGVALIVAGDYGHVLSAPQCPDLLAVADSTTGSGSGASGNKSNGAGLGAGAVPSVASVAALAFAALAYLF